MKTPIKITIAMLAVALLPMAASAQIAYTGRQLNVCKVSIVEYDLDNSPKIHSVNENVNMLEVSSFPLECTICVTKEGYIPYLTTIKCVQNELLRGTNEIEASLILIGSNVNSAKSKGDVVIDDGFTKIKADKIIFTPNTRINANSTIGINF